MNQKLMEMEVSSGHENYIIVAEINDSISSSNSESDESVIAGIMVTLLVLLVMICIVAVIVYALVRYKNNLT